MGWRFRRSIKILPGIRLNFGKNGFTSTTIGGKFFKTNLSDKGVKHTFSAPGTGISYTTQTRKLTTDNFQPSVNAPGWAFILVGAFVVALIFASVVLILDVSSAESRPATTWSNSVNASNPSQSGSTASVTNDEPKNLGEPAFLIANSANVRETPTTDGAITEKILFGAGLQVIKKQGNWVFVDHYGQTGWVQSQYIKYSDIGTQGESFKSNSVYNRSVQSPGKTPFPNFSVPYQNPLYSTPTSPGNGSQAVYVHGYTRKNGTYVSPYSRRTPRR